MAKKILITDDSLTVLAIMQQAIEDNGYEVITAQDGQQALDKAHNDIPDLIILDLMLPKIDGYKVCRMLKFDENYKHIPIIMFTARAREEDMKLGKEVGADAYMTKPFEPDKLFSKINELIGKA